MPAIRPRPVLLAPGGHAYFLAVKYRCEGRIASRATSLHLRLADTRRELTVDIGPSRIGPGDGAGSFDYCARYPGDAPVDPGNSVHVSPCVATESALDRPQAHTRDRSGKKLP